DLAKLGHEAERQTPETQDGEYKELVERIQDALKERAGGVRVTHRLTDSPACIVSDAHGISMNLERLLKASGQKVPSIKPILEINPRHPILERLKDESDTGRFSDWSHILFDQATLAEGGQLEDPATFVKRLNELMLALAGGRASRIWTPGASVVAAVRGVGERRDAASACALNSVSLCLSGFQFFFVSLRVFAPSWWARRRRTRTVELSVNCVK